MHESHITSELLNLALKKAKENKAKKITKIYINISEKDHITPENIKFHFEVSAKNTIAENAKIEIKKANKTFIENIEIE